jgi:phosphoadenosine phosphosulfate reductase
MKKINDVTLSGFPLYATPQQILSAGVTAAKGPVSLACSFSMEDIVIIDMVQELKLPIGVFAIDTGRLNEETYALADTVTKRYGIKIEWFFPRHDPVEMLEREKGLYSFRASLENRQECCRIRKVEPLRRALAGLTGWVTGLRREQSITRKGLTPFEIDQTNGGVLKINPLLQWREEDVAAYTRERKLPTNQLYNQGYRSIGCAPCTRAVKPGEQGRAGRWWWENSEEHKECGIHRR